MWSGDENDDNREWFITRLHEDNLRVWDFCAALEAPKAPSSEKKPSTELLAMAISNIPLSHARTVGDSQET